MKQFISRLTSPSRLLATGALVALLAVPAAADAPAGKVEETQPPLCAALSAPADPDQLKNIEGWTIRYSAAGTGSFRETIIRLAEGSGRSTRFVDGARPTAHIVKVDQRRICLDLGGDAPECLLAISCSDRRVDFVLVGNDAEIKATLTSPDNDRLTHPGDYTNLPEDHDWVPFAQGTVPVVIDASGRVSNHIETRNSINNSCLLRGHPATEHALAYSWLGACRNGLTDGPGTLIVLDQEGQLKRYPINAKDRSYGTTMRDGIYRYSFPQDAMSARVICEGTEHSIPENSGAVTAISVSSYLGGLIKITNKPVRDQIAQSFSAVAQRLCGSKVDVPVRFEFRGVQPRRSSGVRSDFVARFSRSAANGEVLSLKQEQSNPFLLDIKDDNKLSTHERSLFHPFLSSQILSLWRSDVRNQIENRNAPAINLADAIVVDHIATLLALVEGRKLRIGWQSPEFLNGGFVVTERVSTSDPKTAFFSTRKTPEWDRWKNELRIQVPNRQFEVVCIVPPATARRLKSGTTVEVRGRLVSFVGSRITLECTES